MDSEVPKPCCHFIGRDKELEELYTILEENRHVFLYGIAGIGKSELAKAYAKHYKKLFQTIGNIIELIEKDDIPKYLLFLENAFPYMDNYNYHKGMNGIIQELKCLLKTKNIGTDSDQALLLDFQAALETKPEKAIKLEKDALAQIETITADNARLVSDIHANLGGFYRMNSYPDLAREHMEKSISLLDQFNLLHINDSIPQIANYALIFPENILLTLFFLSMNTIFTSFRICENSYK